jgi:hypothetical protein
LVKNATIWRPRLVEALMHGFRPRTGSMPQRRIEGERIPTLTPCHPTVHGFNEGKEETLSAASRGGQR